MQNKVEGSPSNHEMLNNLMMGYESFLSNSPSELDNITYADEFRTFHINRLQGLSRQIFSESLASSLNLNENDLENKRVFIRNLNNAANHIEALLPESPQQLAERNARRQFFYTIISNAVVLAGLGLAFYSFYKNEKQHDLKLSEVSKKLKNLEISNTQLYIELCNVSNALTHELINQEEYHEKMAILYDEILKLNKPQT